MIFKNNLTELNWNLSELFKQVFSKGLITILFIKEFGRLIKRFDCSGIKKTIVTLTNVKVTSIVNLNMQHYIVSRCYKLQ